MFNDKFIIISRIKNLSIYFIFVLFILLNFLDFFQLFSLLSKTPNDIDFFKKLLSWALILYLFASLSITKIITGFKDRFYDLMLLVGYSCIAVPSMLIFYLVNVDFSTFSIFSFFANDSTYQSLGQFNFEISLIGIVIIAIFSILIFLKLPIHKESFIGSFNLDMENFFAQFQKLGLIFIFNLFFAYTFFKFFMEWFALAVDAALLVIGFLYYLYYFLIKKEEKFTIQSLLSHVVNTGNSFFKQLILYLQDKKTFFIAISLLLTIHAMIDIGVYLIPFATGIDNGLYNVLGSDFDSTLPLFSTENSYLHYQYNQIINNEVINSAIKPILTILLLAIEILVYIQTILFYFVLLFMPFFIFFSTLQNRFQVPSKKVIMFTLMMVFFQIILFLSPNLNNPIEFSISLTEHKQGVVFETNSLFQDINTNSQSEIITQISSVVVLQLFILLFLFMRYEKYQQFWISTFYISILVFFLLYSAVFAQNYIQTSYNQIYNPTHLKYDIELAASSELYMNLSKEITLLNLSPTKLASLKSPEILVDTDLYRFVDRTNFSNSRNYLGIELTVKNNFIEKFNFIPVDESSNHQIFIYNYLNLFDNRSVEKIYIIIKGDDNLLSQAVNMNQNVLNPEFLESSLLSTRPSTPIFSIIQRSFLLIIVSIFYIGGLIAYAIFYRNALEELKRRLF